jgi:hypothetical protein
LLLPDNLHYIARLLKFFFILENEKGNESKIGIEPMDRFAPINQFSQHDGRGGQ